MAHRTAFRDLNLSNSFLFAAALEEPEICRQVLEYLLERPIGPIEVRAERSLLFHGDFRCIRLDVFASETDGTTRIDYDLEMQNLNKKKPEELNLPLRSRYHQAEMDAVALKPGDDFSDLHPSVIIFLCTFDPFGRGRYRYTFLPWCQEERFPLEDGTLRIFLNTCGKNRESVSKELINFLGYVSNSTDAYVKTVNDGRLSALHERLREVKQSRELEARYMQFQELLEQSRQEGMERGELKGIQKGSRRMLDLVLKLHADGRDDSIAQLQTDPSLEERLLREYRLL